MKKAVPIPSVTSVKAIYLRINIFVYSLSNFYIVILFMIEDS